MARGTATRHRDTARDSTRSRPQAARSNAARKRASRRWLVPLGLAALAALAALLLFLRADRAGAGALATLEAGDFHSLAFSPSNPDVAFFGHHNGLLQTTDAGKSWNKLVDRANFDAMGLAVSQADPRRLYLAGHSIFQTSADGGASWQAVQHNLPGTDLHGFAMNPDDPNRLTALVVGQGAFGSADGGRTWQRLPGQLPGDVMALASAGGSPETLYAGSMSAGVLRSTDGGRSWVSAANGLGGRNVMALAVDPAARQTVYVGVAGGLSKSTDGGASWASLPFPGDSPVALAVSPTQPGRLLAISAKERQGLVYRSDDGGLSWGAGR